MLQEKENITKEYREWWSRKSYFQQVNTYTHTTYQVNLVIREENKENHVKKERSQNRRIKKSNMTLGSNSQ